MCNLCSVNRVYDYGGVDVRITVLSLTHLIVEPCNRPDTINRGTEIEYLLLLYNSIETVHSPSFITNLVF